MPIFSFLGYTLTELFRKWDKSQQIYKQNSSTLIHQAVSLKRVEKKKSLGRHNRDISLKICWGSHLRNDCLITFRKMQKQPRKVFYKKAVLKDSATFTGKHLRWNLFLIQNIAKLLGVPILKDIFKRLLLKICWWN